MWALAFVLSNGVLVDSGHDYPSFEGCAEIGQAVLDERATDAAKHGGVWTVEFACVEVE